MVCVSMLKISNVFQLIFYVTWIVIFDAFFNVKRTQQNLKKNTWPMFRMTTQVPHSLSGSKIAQNALSIVFFVLISVPLS